MTAVKPLTDSAVKTAKFDTTAPANNTRRDGSGLELRISKSSKSWVFKYVNPVLSCPGSPDAPGRPRSASPGD